MNNRICIKIEHNLYSLYKKAAIAGELVYIDDMNFSVVKSQPGLWPNFCFNIQCPNIKLEKISIKITNEMKLFNIPPILIAGTEVDQQLLHYIVTKQGMRMINQWTSMALNITEILKQPLINNFKVSKITSVEHLSIFLQNVNNWLMNGRLLDPFVFKGFLNDENIGLYLGWLNGEVVATSLLYCENGVAGIYMVAVNNQHRRMGFGKAIISHLLNEALKQNCNQVVLHATRMGEKLYRSLGFEAYGKIDIYWLMGNEYI